VVEILREGKALACGLVANLSFLGSRAVRTKTIQLGEAKVGIAISLGAYIIGINERDNWSGA